VNFSAADRVFYGRIEGIDDLITFEAKSVDELIKAFEESVEEYLALCEQTGKHRQRSYKGSFNVRIHPDLHKNAALLSADLGISLNQFVEEAIGEYIHARQNR
jgi:predicted HicB family RNase H-like nuclease